MVALLNGVLTFFGMPMMHGALPHSPLHVRAMADVEDRVDQGHIYQRYIYDLFAARYFVEKWTTENS